MKRLIILFSLMFILSSCGYNKVVKNANVPQEKVVETIEKNPVKLDKGIEYIKMPIDNLDMDMIKELNISTVILDINAIRIPDKNFKTDFKELKKLESAISSLEENKINYIISFTSGPGLSKDGKIQTLYKNSTHRVYFSKMVNEIINRYSKNKGFKGIEINLFSLNISPEIFNNCIKEIANSIKSDVKKQIVLHQLTFENQLNNINLTNNTVYVINISPSSLTYPGYGVFNNKSVKLNKNIILSMFQDIKKNYGNNVIININAPFNNDYKVFLQDIIEIQRMLEFGVCIKIENSLYLSNSEIKSIIKKYAK
ncbi:MAG: hypothetical protein N2594_03220 [Clostridiales bacterium]|nr:hypothetical protein [Clostridiales bacterium]